MVIIYDVLESGEQVAVANCDTLEQALSQATVQQTVEIREGSMVRVVQRGTQGD